MLPSIPDRLLSFLRTPPFFPLFFCFFFVFFFFFLGPVKSNPVSRLQEVCSRDCLANASSPSPFDPWSFCVFLEEKGDLSLRSGSCAPGMTLHILSFFSSSCCLFFFCAIHRLKNSPTTRFLSVDCSLLSPHAPLIVDGIFEEPARPTSFPLFPPTSFSPFFLRKFFSLETRRARSKRRPRS